MVAYTANFKPRRKACPKGNRSAAPPCYDGDRFVMHRPRTIVRVVFPVLVGHVLLPASFVARLWHTSHHDLITWLLEFYLASSYVTFVYVAGSWSWLGNATRRLLVALLVAAAATSVPHGAARAGAPASSAFELAMNTVLGTRSSA